MERCGFFDANLVGEEYDRVYLAKEFAAYFASFIGNGVFAGKSDELQVLAMPTPEMQITVKSGQGWINGYWYQNTDDLYLPIDVADGTLNRIDTVVLRLGFSERTMWIEVKKGTFAVTPTAPELMRNADYYELKLAEIYIGAGAIKITQANITDTRLNSEVCGFVTQTVETIETTTWYNQLDEYCKEYMTKMDRYFVEFQQSSEMEFDVWFDGVQSQLSGDVAGNLLVQINNNKEKIGELTTTLESTNARLETVEENVAELVGSVPKELTSTLSAGSTSLAFTDESITDTSTIDIYSSAYGVSPKTANISDNTLTLTFKAQTTNVDIKVVIS